MQVHTGMTQETTSSVNLGAAKEGDDEGSDVSMNRSDSEARFSRRQESPDLHQTNLTFVNNTSEVDTSDDRSPTRQLDVVSAHQQSDPIPGSLPAARRSRKMAPRHARPKCHLLSSSAGLAAVSSPASTLPQSHAPATDPSHEGQFYVDESVNEIGNEDCANYSDASSNAIERPRPSKRL